MRRSLPLELRLDRIAYRFPYGIYVQNAALIATDSDGRKFELLSIPQAHIALARLPLGSGPLVIERLHLKDPAVHLIETDRGMVGRRRLLRFI